jgi:tRNA threonylcarbamoyladenosine biosynthesis protein TsaE
MEKHYEVATPADLKIIIEEIFSWWGADRGDALVLALEGDLGAGKTTFTQELGRYFKVSEAITSPTFAIMKQYPLEHKEFDLLVHIDAYRIEDETEVAPLKLEDILERPKTLVCIEWPEQIYQVVPKSAVRIKIDITDDEKRTVKLELPSEK